MHPVLLLGAGSLLLCSNKIRQVSKQCMQMAAEGAVELGEQPGSLAVNDTFTAIVEGKGAKAVDNNFFLVNVPIGTCETTTFVNKFPRVRLRMGPARCGGAALHDRSNDDDEKDAHPPLPP